MEASLSIPRELTHTLEKSARSCGAQVHTIDYDPFADPISLSIEITAASKPVTSQLCETVTKQTRLSLALLPDFCEKKVNLTVGSVPASDTITDYASAIDQRICLTLTNGTHQTGILKKVLEQNLT